MPPDSNLFVMEHSKKIINILLNILFCAALLRFFTQNAFLRPYAGSAAKELAGGLLLLASLYANYFLLYPKLHEKHCWLYWGCVIALVFIAACIDIAIAYENIEKCCAPIIQAKGRFDYYSKCIIFVAGRNLAFNFFPFMLRERQMLQQALNKEVQIVYQEFRKIDVIDKEKNLVFIPIDDIYYCVKNSNENHFYTVEGKDYYRPGSMKHLEQLFSEEEFIRISPSIMVPFRFIRSCDGNGVLMKNMPWSPQKLYFEFDPKHRVEIARKVGMGLRNYRAESREKRQKPVRNTKNRKPSVPPKEKLDEILIDIMLHPGFNTKKLNEDTGFSLSTIERCITELRKKRFIQHEGSKKTGGYRVTKKGAAAIGEEQAAVSS